MNTENDDLDLGRRLRNVADGVAADPSDSETIEVEAIMQRGRHRRRRTSQLRAGAAAVVLLAAAGGAVVASNRDARPDERVQIAEPDQAERADEESALGIELPTAARGLVAASTGLPAADGAVRSVAANWATTDADTLSGVRSVVQLSDGTFYALSTVPGEHNWRDGPPPAAIFRSDDGVTWANPQTSSGFAASSLAAVGDHLVALGTAPGTAETKNGSPLHRAAVGYSSDGGATWELAELPIDLSALAGLDAWASTQLTGIAAVDGGVVAAVVPSVWLDVRELAPGVIDEESPWHWTETGLQLMVPRSEPPADFDVEAICGEGFELISLGDNTPACDGPDEGDTTTLWRGVFGHDPGEVLSYDSLGVAAEVQQLLLNRPALFHVATDGAITEVALPDASTDSSNGVSVQLRGADGEAILQVLESGGNLEEYGDHATPASFPTANMYSSRDGRSWQRIDGPALAGGGWLNGVARVGDALVGFAHGANLEVVAQTPGGWVSSAVTDFVDPEGPYSVWPQWQHADDGGVIVAVGSSLDVIAAAGGVDIELNGAAEGYVLRLINDHGGAELRDASGQVVAAGRLWDEGEDEAVEGGEPIGSIRAGEEGFVITTLDGTVVTAPHESFERAMEEAYNESRDPDGVAPAPAWVLYSPNGIDWTVVALPDIETGEHRQIHAARVVDGTLIVSEQLYSEGDSEEQNSRTRTYSQPIS